MTLPECVFAAESVVVFLTTSPSSLDGQLLRVRTLLTMFVGQTASLSVLLHVHLSVTLTHVIGDAVRLLTSLTHDGRDVRRTVGLEGGVRT